MMGVVKPNPTFSHSSTAYLDRQPSHAPSDHSLPASLPKNPTLVSIEARRRLQARAEAELEHFRQAKSPGREFLDIATISRILTARSRGSKPEEIEAHFKLKPETMAGLGCVDLAERP